MNSISGRGAIRGRGARSNISHRFQRRSVVAEPAEAVDGEPPVTQVLPVRARSVITRNRSPDVGFNLSVNPYQGCEHGCVYCFARPSHAYHDLSPGLDFETRILAKTNAVDCFVRELAAPSYRCEPIAIGVNTDAYQPAERDLRITRGLLETCLARRQPAILITKSRLILRDKDLLAELARLRLVRVAVSLTTLDHDLKRRLEPRTAGPGARLGVIGELAGAGVPVSVMVAPIIPRINDAEMERILAAAAARGARSASYVLLRLPDEVEPLFRDWLAVHFPERARAVMGILQDCHRGKAYRSAFHTRMRGEGEFAEIIGQRFAVARRRAGLDRQLEPLDTSRFVRVRKEPETGGQLDLF
ncbi:PA0069 family radical SAM protein [Elongatibacter sediminis]|uniref:PA0069 family radical SAM protein n=1 Tax=Elongatibacter sediminis TaxID=3119006 RepID=A0AAW9RG71_9GAMM